MEEVGNRKEKHQIPRANSVNIYRQKTCNLSYRLFSLEYTAGKSWLRIKPTWQRVPNG